MVLVLWLQKSLPIKLPPWGGFLANTGGVLGHSQVKINVPYLPLGERDVNRSAQLFPEHTHIGNSNILEYGPSWGSFRPSQTSFKGVMTYCCNVGI